MRDTFSAGRSGARYDAIDIPRRLDTGAGGGGRNHPQTPKRTGRHNHLSMTRDKRSFTTTRT